MPPPAPELTAMVGGGPNGFAVARVGSLLPVIKAFGVFSGSILGPVLVMMM